MRLSLLISVVAFFVVGGTILLDQWIAGLASGRFILGTAILNAGVCIGLFAIISAIGSAISIVLGDEAIDDTSGHEAAQTRADSAFTAGAPSEGEPPTANSLSSSPARQRQAVDDAINPWIGRTQSG
jgi:hypothetical protein